MTRYHEERYERDGVMVPVRFYSTSFPVDDWMERMRSTLDLIPARQLNLFSIRGSGAIEFKTLYRDGREYGGGSYGYSGYQFASGTSSSNWVRVSSMAMGEPQNAETIYTFLHEFGHLVDHWEFAHGLAAPKRCIDRLKENFPLACLAMLRSYHGGGSTGPSEHFGDVYGFYIANELGGESHRVHRRGPRWRCVRECARWDEELSALVASQGVELPPPHSDDMMRLRYAGLFRTEPFAGVLPQGLAASSRYGTTSGAGVAHPRHVGHPRRRIRMPTGGSDGPNWLAP